MQTIQTELRNAPSSQFLPGKDFMSCYSRLNKVCSVTLISLEPLRRSMSRESMFVPSEPDSSRSLNPSSASCSVEIRTETFNTRLFFPFLSKSLPVFHRCTPAHISCFSKFAEALITFVSDNSVLHRVIAGVMTSKEIIMGLCLLSLGKAPLPLSFRDVYMFILCKAGRGIKLTLILRGQRSAY